MIFEAFSSARNSILLQSPCKMANIFRIVAYWDSTFYHQKKEKKCWEKKPGFHVQKLLQLGGFPSYFPTDFLVKASVPGGVLEG